VVGADGLEPPTYAL